MESKSVDQLHDQIDAMVLSIFESMRNESGATPSVQADSKLISTRYKEACNMVDNLIGINVTETEQMTELAELTDSFEASKARTFILQAQLCELKREIDEKLQVALGGKP